MKTGPRESTRIRVLAVDGGGVRGILPVRVLVALEEMTGRPTAELFDVLVGTSIGGIGVLGLMRPGTVGKPKWTARDLLNVYSTRAAEIFPDTSLSWPQSLQQVSEMIRRPSPTAALLGSNPGLGNARYDPAGLIDILTGQLGGTMMSQALKHTIVTSYDVRSQQPVIFDSAAVTNGDQDDIPMITVARATSAAPSYFPPMVDTDRHGEERLMVDGGVFANNPALLGFQAALEAGAAPDGVVLVSLGTGLPGPNSSLSRSEYMGLSWFRLAQSLLESAQVGNVAVIDSFLKTAVGATYWRFDTALTGDIEHDMDNTTEDHVKWLDTAGKAMVGERIADLKRLAEALTEG
jgi:patatin-like phospholipase/acyl hydrolase